jgi:hypothetical protein
MAKKNLMSQANDSANSVTDLVELSDEALSGVCGGKIDPNWLKNWELRNNPKTANTTLRPS